MLKALRKNSKIIIWAVVASFILWGGFSFGVSFRKEGRVAGEIFGKDITFQEYDSFFRASQIFSASGQENKNPDLLKQQTWQSLILSRQAKSQKLEVTDGEVRREVLRLLEAQKIVDPTPDTYRRWLESTVRETPVQFENKIREILRIRKLITSINETPMETPTEDEVHEAFFLDQNQFSAELVRFETEEAAKEFYDNHQSPRSWEQFAKEESDRVETGPMTSLNGWIGARLPKEKALFFHEQASNFVTEPVLIGSQFVVFRVLEIKVADVANLQGELKDQYFERLTVQKKNTRFLLWLQDIFQQANLKDYLPGAKSATPPAQ